MLEMWLKIKHSECNLKCIFCPPENLYGSYLNYSYVSNLLTEAQKEGVNKIWYTGGEPSISPWFKRVVRNAHNLGMVQKLTTNGLLLHKLQDELNKFCRINISCHSLNKEVYNYITGGGDLNLLKENIHMASLETEVRLNIVICKYNISEVNLFMSFCLENNLIPRFIFLRDRSRSCSHTKIINDIYVNEADFWKKLGYPKIKEIKTVNSNNIKATYYRDDDQQILGIVRLTNECEKDHCNILFVDSKRRLYSCRGKNRRYFSEGKLREVIESKRTRTFKRGKSHECVSFKD